MIASLSRNPLVGVIRQTIADEIERGRFRPGDKLPPERQLAESLGVSRGALREAIRTLEAEGRLTSRHGIGVEIANNPTKPLCQTIERLLPEEINRLRQAAEARLIIEPELAALAAIHGTAEESALLAETIERLGAATNLPEAIDADLDFHHSIAKMARNQILQLLLQSLAELGKQSRALTLEIFSFAKVSEHHRHIAETIRRKDSSLARSTMRSHVQKALEDLTLS